MKSIQNITPVRDVIVSQQDTQQQKNLTPHQHHTQKPAVFKNGEMLRATILEALGGENFLLNVPGGTLEAQIAGGFHAGTELMLRVLSTEGKLFFKAIGIPATGEKTKLAEMLRLLGLPIDDENIALLKEAMKGAAFVEFDKLREVFSALKNINSQFPEKEVLKTLLQMQSAGTPLTETALKKLWSFFQYAHEAFSELCKKLLSDEVPQGFSGRLQHLFTNGMMAVDKLLPLLKEILVQQDKFSDEILKSAGELFALIEAKNIVNLYAAASGLPLFALMLMAGDSEFHLWRIRFKRFKKGKSTISVFSFLLHLPKLGEASVDGTLHDNRITLHLTTTPETAAILLERTILLKIGLERSGYEVNMIYCRGASEEESPGTHFPGGISMTV